MHPFDRYGLLTNLDLLKEFSGKPLRKSMRVNTLKCSVEEFKMWAAARQWKIEPVPWCREGFYVDRDDRSEAMGKDLLHVLGYVYMQEAASMLPVALLSPQPGDTVLDMSAAPGSKTTQVACALTPCPSPGGRGVTSVRGGQEGQKGGLIFANDVQEKRIWSLLSNIQRCGVSDIAVTRKVGQWFAGNMTECFDRVLCDAPCTAQGTARKDSDALRYCSDENIGKMARLQRELLESAIHACKVGGRVVYSTCTLTPEENEGVVMSILSKFGDRLAVVDPRELIIDNGQLTMTAAVEDSMRVQESLSHYQLSIINYPLPLARLWPHTYDTEGFFSAVLEKRTPTKDPKRENVDLHQFDVLPNARMREIKARLIDWYGTSFLRDDETLVSTKEQIYMIPEALLRFRIPLHPYYVGLPFGKPTEHGLVRLSHDMATLRGHEATKQVLHLPATEMRRVLAGVNVDTSAIHVDEGDVLLGLEDNILQRTLIFGRGVLKKGVLLNRLPREIVRMFAG